MLHLSLSPQLIQHPWIIIRTKTLLEYLHIIIGISMACNHPPPSGTSTESSTSSARPRAPKQPLYSLTYYTHHPDHLRTSSVA